MNLHIVTLNIPFPPDYGGMIDTYYRIRALHDFGVRIHLHCFEYGRQYSPELELLCETTNYYPRKSGLLRQLSRIPYIVFSRQSKRLLANLIKNDYPVLFDGLHSTYYVNHPALSLRKKLIRLHNIEHQYYNNLADNETNLIKKAYFILEAAKLKRFEKVLEKADFILPVSDIDHEYFESKYHNSVFLAPFHPFYESKSLPGTGDYIIYHGDLSVNENAAIAINLISNVFSKIPFKCIITGKEPPGILFEKAAPYSNIKIISNPDNDEMESFITNAQINVLPALANNGFKLKLLIALYSGRHVLVNSVVGKNFSVKNLCHTANSDEEMVNKVHQLMEEPFTCEMIHDRQRVLSETFDIRVNAKKLMELVGQVKII